MEAYGAETNSETPLSGGEGWLMRLRWLVDGSSVVARHFLDARRCRAQRHNEHLWLDIDWRIQSFHVSASLVHVETICRARDRKIGRAARRRPECGRLAHPLDNHAPLRATERRFQQLCAFRLVLLIAAAPRRALRLECTDLLRAAADVLSTVPSIGTAVQRRPQRRLSRGSYS